MNKNFDDIVFENRNKDYGAYYLRKLYNKTLIRALIFSISTASIISIFLLVLFISRNENEYISNKDLIYYEVYDMQNITEFEEIKKYIPPKIEKEINKESNKNFIIADSLTENKFIETEFENQYSDSLNQIDSLSDISNIANENVENQTIYYYIDKDTGLPCDITALRSFIFENIIYPEVAIKENISGTVIIQFNATESGKVDSLIITQSINTALDNEVIRVIKILPEKILGTNYNKNLKIWYILPIKFSKL